MSIETTIQTLLTQLHDPVLIKPLSEWPITPIISQEKNHLSIRLLTDFPNRFLHPLLPNLEHTIAQHLPTMSVQITLEQTIRAHRTQLPGKGLRGIKNTIAIASGKGGVGKSTVAVNLATALASAGARVGIIDADIYGPSIPLMLGKTKPVAIAGDQYLPVTTHGIQAMSIGYLTEDDPALIWRGPMLAKSFIQMLDITRWEDLDYLIIDLPPGTGDIQLSLVQKIPLTGAVIVTTPQTVASLDAEKAVKMFHKTHIDVLGMIENMAQHHCPHCGHTETIFGHGGALALCQQYQCQLLGQLPLNSQIRQDCDQGTPTAAQPNNPLSPMFLKIALAMCLAIAKKPINYASQFPPIVLE